MMMVMMMMVMMMMVMMMMMMMMISLIPFVLVENGNTGRQLLDGWECVI